MTPSRIAALALFIAAAPAQARLVSFEIEKQAAYGRFEGVEFRRIDAKVRGEIAREDGIPDIDRVIAAGRKPVYETRVLLIVPAARANGALLLDVPNRGRPISHALYNGLREPPTGVGSTEPGTGFLQRRGFALASVTWEYGEGIVVPRFPDGAGEERNVEAAAFAAIRDVAVFLRDAKADDAGRPNPLAGMIDRAYGTGFSQTARVLRTLLSRGYNTAGGRMVFAGLHVHAGASGQMPILEAGTGAASATASPTPNFVRPDLHGIREPPFTWEEIVAAMRARNEPLPKIVVTNMTTDYVSLRASLARTGAQGGSAEAPLPPNVRMYDVAGASHSLTSVATHASCSLPLARLDYRPVMRSAREPRRVGFAGDRAAAERSDAAHEGDARRDRAARPGAPSEGHRSCSPRLPDGNVAGGVRLPEVDVPLGVNAVQNTVDKDPCRLSAGYVAYAPGVLKARYRSPSEYTKRIAASADALVQRRLLPREDAEAIVSAAQGVRWDD